MGADALSDVLQTVRLTGAVFFYFQLKGSWVAEAPPVEQCRPYVLPRAQHLIEFHLVPRGHCWAGILNEEMVELNEGDMIVFPQGDPHVVASRPGMRNPPDMRHYEGADKTQMPFINVLGTGDEDPTEVVCGFFGCDNRPFNPLLAGLPRMLHVKGDALPGKAWLPLFSEIAAEESRAKRSGGENVLSRMSELMFVELIRAYIASLPEGQTGWLAGLRDRAVGSALNLLHGRPAHDWTLDELAKESGLSRSSFVDRFTALIGQPPMQYLASWRMQLAANRLLNGTDNVAKVAADVGYESEAAFSRAFKRVVGMSPAAWRKAER